MPGCGELPLGLSAFQGPGSGRGWRGWVQRWFRDRSCPTATTRHEGASEIVFIARGAIRRTFATRMIPRIDEAFIGGERRAQRLS